MFDFGYDEEEPKRRKRFGKIERETLYKAQKGRCMYCGFKGEMAHFDVDHKTPVARNGKDNLGNLQMLCKPCNSRKGDLTDGEFRKKYRLPGARSLEAKNPPKKRIPQSDFDTVSKQNSQKKKAARRREEGHYYDEDDSFGFGW